MDASARLRQAAADLAALRSRSDLPASLRARRDELRIWQSKRLATTHADLLASPRYRPATRFFLDELYGVKDFSQRDAALARVIPTMVRFLPDSALRTIADAVELEALSERLDLLTAQALDADAQLNGRPIEEPSYCRAFRAAGDRADRQRQIALVDSVGRALDSLVRTPMIGTLLKTMHRPAQIAGLGAMQDFLMAGFTAFKSMGGAQDFLKTLIERENNLMQQIYAGHD